MSVLCVRFCLLAVLTCGTRGDEPLELELELRIIITGEVLGTVPTAGRAGARSHAVLLVSPPHDNSSTAGFSLATAPGQRACRGSIFNTSHIRSRAHRPFLASRLAPPALLPTCRQQEKCPRSGFLGRSPTRPTGHFPGLRHLGLLPLPTTPTLPSPGYNGHTYCTRADTLQATRRRGGSTLVSTVLVPQGQSSSSLF